MSNFNLVLRTYTAMRQMTPDDLALLVTLRSLNDTDREKLIEALSDKPQKKAGKKTAGGGGRSAGKSARASGMAKTLNDNLSQRRQETIDDVVQHDTGESVRCQFTRADGSTCRLLADHNIHHLTTAREYHYFVAPPASSAAGASGD